MLDQKRETTAHTVMAATNFSLPITAQSTPPTTGTGGGFGQPSGVAIGPAAGSFGGVAATHPGSTFQAINNPRQQVRFQVQPQCTVLVKPVFPLPEDGTDSNGARRKDFLMTINSVSTSNMYDPSAIDLNKYRFQGQVVCTVQQANVFLEKMARLGVNSSDGTLTNPKSMNLTPLEEFMYKRFQERAEVRENYYTYGENFSEASMALRYPQAHESPVRAAQIPQIVCDVFHPLGVYNSRSTHNAMQSMSGRIPHNNISDILGVNISNYSFMRDIWGTQMRAGDLLEFVCYSSEHPTVTNRFTGENGGSSGIPVTFHRTKANSKSKKEMVTYVQFQPMCGLQYCRLEDLFVNKNIGVIPKHDGAAAKTIETYKDPQRATVNSNLYIEDSAVDVSGGEANVNYTTEFLKHIFANDGDRHHVRIPIARLWVAPLHQPFMHKKKFPAPYKQDFNIVGYNAGRSDMNGSLDSDWVLPNQNVGNLVYNKSKEFHNIEVELLSAHMELF